MSIEQIQFGPYLPDEDPTAVRQMGNELGARLEGVRDRFWDTLDTLPNLNDEYASEIATVNEIVEKDGWEPVPITVLGGKDYESTVSLLGQTHSDANGGQYVLGRIIAREVPGPTPELSRQVMLGNLLHEAAHATADDARSHQPVVAWRTSVNRADNTSVRSSYATLTAPQGGFDKVGVSPQGKFKIGIFLEEGFADLYRVRGLQAKGLEVQFGPPEARLPSHIYEDVRYTASEPTDLSELVAGDGNAIPARFLLAAGMVAPDRVHTNEMEPAPAAYALDLLDRHLLDVDPASPSLFQQMKHARQSPLLQREIIKRINSVQPGLYDELRRLLYNAEDFRSGLVIVQKAIVAAQQASGVSIARTNRQPYVLQDTLVL